MNEAEDLDMIVRAIDEAENLIKGHLELNSADASTTISRVHEALSAPVLSQALERARLRALNS
ncbi:MAG: hypothetical protein EON84_06975, partial [Bradyrhizobiaceae bacterium]